MENEMKRGKPIAIHENYKTDNPIKEESNFNSIDNTKRITRNKSKNNLGLNNKIAQKINHYSYKWNAKNT